MDQAEGARTFAAGGDAYDSFMGRYSRPLAERFVDVAGVGSGLTALDVGCGPGALTGVLAARLGPESVAAVDPSPPFVTACAARHPDVDVRAGRAEDLPFADDTFDLALAQLVLHFVTDAPAAVAEMARVVRPGGTVGACVWDFADGMQLLAAYWAAAVELDPTAPDERAAMRFGRPGEIAELLTAGGLLDVDDQMLTVESAYADFGELWAGFLAGIGPAGAHATSRTPDEQRRLAEGVFRRVGSPAAEFTLSARAHCAVGRVP